MRCLPSAQSWLGIGILIASTVIAKQVGIARVLSAWSWLALGD